MGPLPLLAALSTVLWAQSQTQQQADAARARIEKNKADIRYVQDAGIKIWELEGWEPQHRCALADAIRAASGAVARLHANNFDAVASAYKNYCSFAGTLTNLNQSIWAAYREIVGDDGGKKENFKRGCLSHQQDTYNAVAAARLNGLVVRKIVIGNGMEHHAVVVYPDGGNWRNGVVLDGWPCQSAQPNRMTFLLRSTDDTKGWESNFAALGFLGSTRLED